MEVRDSVKSPSLPREELEVVWFIYIMYIIYEI
jgi:hypothetical protein